MKYIKTMKTFIKESLEHIGISNEEINEILKGYLMAALWTEEERLNDEYESENTYVEEDDDDDDEEETEIDRLVKMQNNLNNKSFSGFIEDDIEVNSKIQAYLDIRNFILEAGGAAVAEAIDDNGTEQLGHDIWLTRNGHGAGFMDRDYDNVVDLERAAKKLKEVDMYIGDDNMLYFSNAN